MAFLITTAVRAAPLAVASRSADDGRASSARSISRRIAGRVIGLAATCPAARSPRPAAAAPRRGPPAASAFNFGGGGNGSGDGGGMGGGGGDGDQPGGGSDSPNGRASLLAAVAVTVVAHALTAHRCSALCGAGGKEDSSPPATTDDLVDRIVDVAGPIAANLGFSGALGLASATAFKALGGVLAVAIGVAFVAVQVLSHYGVITVHWTNVNEKVVTLVDANADGKLDSSDFRVWGKKLLAVLAEGVPSVGGFAAGFAMGLRF